jgi:hypothetical protein
VRERGARVIDERNGKEEGERQSIRKTIKRERRERANTYTYTLTTTTAAAASSKRAKKENPKTQVTHLLGIVLFLGRKEKVCSRSLLPSLLLHQHHHH